MHCDNRRKMFIYTAVRDVIFTTMYFSAWCWSVADDWLFLDRARRDWRRTQNCSFLSRAHQNRTSVSLPYPIWHTLGIEPRSRNSHPILIIIRSRTPRGYWNQYHRWSRRHYVSIIKSSYCYNWFIIFFLYLLDPVHSCPRTTRPKSIRTEYLGFTIPKGPWQYLNQGERQWTKRQDSQN